MLVATFTLVDNQKPFYLENSKKSIVHEKRKKKRTKKKLTLLTSQQVFDLMNETGFIFLKEIPKV